MAQRVGFKVLPNTKDELLLDRLLTILATVERERPNFKQLRESLRELGIWKREETPEILEFFGVSGLSERGRITLRPPANQLLAADSPAERQKVLVSHLYQANPLLVKYILEALDVTDGGRLHSTHELYRYISSYAYPGDYIKLPDFQSFIKWLGVAGAVRIIGIRWGLDEAGKAQLPVVRSLDVEEFLEDEALEDEDAMVDLPDAPPGNTPPDFDEEARMEPESTTESGVAQRDPSAPPKRPARTPPPLQGPAMRPGRRPGSDSGVTPSPRERLETVALVKAWWGGFAHKRVVGARELGVVPNDYAKDFKVFLLRMMTAAVLLDSEGRKAPVRAFLARLDELAAFDRIASAVGGLEEVLAEADWFRGQLWFERLAESLVHTLRFRHLLEVNGERLAADFKEALEVERGGAMVAERVLADLFGGSFYMASFWLIREMYSLGLWDHAAVAAVAVVPTYQTREAAFRLGFVDSLYADGFASLLTTSQILARFFGEDCGFNAPLEQLADGFGCRFRCPHVTTCPLACREKRSL